MALTKKLRRVWLYDDPECVLLVDAEQDVVPCGRILPATATVGQRFYLFASGLYHCVTPNSWTLMDAYGGGTGSLAWADITGKPSTFAPSVHGHPISDVTSLQTSLDAKCASNDSRLSDARPPLSHNHAIGDVTNLQTSLNAKAPLASPAFTGTPTGISKTHIGLGNVDNTSDASKPVSTAQQTALNGKEAANANIQAHIASAHAPSNAQKNSDILKAEIEAVLTGQISSHSHAGGGFAWTAVLILVSDVSTGANVTPVNVTGLSFAFEANSKYLIEVFAVMQSPAATTGYGLQLDVSAAVTLAALTFFHQLANTGTLSGGSSIADDASVGVSSGVPSANVAVPLYASGLLVTGANPGTAQLRLRSEVAAVSTMKANSMMRVMKAA